MGKLEGTTPKLAPDEPRVPMPAKAKPGRLFYSGAAALVLVLMLLGFQQYYLYGKGYPGRDIAPPMQPLVFVHATAMTTCVELILVQPLLVPNGHAGVHTPVDSLGVVLPGCVAAVSREESSCLCATAGLFQGSDVPGPSLSLVTIDRLPFPRPDDPLLQARREVAGDASFNLIDLPRAATLLAQAAGRLIRNTTDRGVVDF